MASLQDADSGKCFSAILHRLLCTGSAPTHPSDQLPERNPPVKSPKTGVQPARAPSGTPGIVARLMGLDSPPDMNWVPKQRRSLESFLRSRSVSFIDYMQPVQFDLATNAAQHRRAKTSVSFREVPTLWHSRDRDAFVLCFDKRVGRSKNSRDCVRERSHALGHKKDVKRKQRATNLMKEKCLVKPAAEDVPAGLRSTTAKKRNRSVKPSSSLSVPPRIEAPIMAENSWPVGLNSRRKSSGKINKRWEHPCPKLIRPSIADDQEARASSIKAQRLQRTRKDGCAVKMLVLVRRLTEKETNGSDWIGKGVMRFDEFEEICFHFGQQIFDLLLNQVLDELICIGVLSERRPLRVQQLTLLSATVCSLLSGGQEGTMARQNKAREIRWFVDELIRKGEAEIEESRKRQEAKAEANKQKEIMKKRSEEVAEKRAEIRVQNEEMTQKQAEMEVQKEAEAMERQKSGKEKAD
ncbi:hypothetical protein RJ639_003629 [Escallonia herrerae]|uniref:DUF3741 domain-containing protein n=1 Tax=Escallonia herrerae TaxID=1293975 RepID=A0AA89B1Q9_9ASTE|nr:hypothetical protein RJ639_003629 [Escallonia herrerae]